MKTNYIIIALSALILTGFATAAQSSLSHQSGANNREVKIAPVVKTVVFYVSPGGSDANQGTINKPFKTLEKVSNVIRGIRGRMAGDIVVWLRGGNYPMPATLVFTSADFGNKGCVVTYKAYPGETPVISGGKTVSGWTLHDAKRNIWQAKVNADDNFRQIYVNGVKAIRARSDGDMGLKLITSGYKTSDNSLQAYHNISDMEIITSRRVWTQDRLPVASISDSIITIAQPCWSKVGKIWGKLGAGGGARNYTNVAWLENAYELMNKPGYWYLDRKAHTLYYIPRSGENMATATVEVPVLEQLISVEADGNNPVSNLRFDGLGFRLTNWLQPSTGVGLTSNQANQEDPPMKAALDFSGAHHVKVTHCTFRQVGGNGINFGRASQNDTVNHCFFSDIAGSAIQCGQVSHEAARLPLGSADIVANITLSNCLIHDIGTDYQAACGIFLGYVQACTIEHNEIFSVPYSGISLGWGWTGDKPVYTSGNRILFNKIHDHMQVLADGGGIYCNGYEQTGLIQGNYIYDQGHKFAEIYLDDGSTNWVVKSNVCKANSSVALWYYYKGSNNQADSNFIDKDKEYNKSVTSTVKNTHVISNNIWPQEAEIIMKNAGVEPE